MNKDGRADDPKVGPVAQFSVFRSIFVSFWVSVAILRPVFRHTEVVDQSEASIEVT